MLTVNNVCNKYFIMDNSIKDNGKPVGKVSAWFNSMKEATIAMMQINKPNLYSLNRKQYRDLLT